jgi:HEAT repeat protein
MSAGVVAPPSAASAAAAASSAASTADESIPDLPVYEAPLDPVRQLVGQAANPNLPEAQADRVFREIVALGANALPSLASIYRDPQSSDAENWIAARAMGRIGGEGARKTLVDGLGSTRIISRLGAVSALQLLKDKASVEPLEKALFDQAAAVRASAADALGAIGERHSSIALSQALDLPANFHQGRSLFVRSHIVQALGDVGSIGGIEALVSVIDEDDAQLALGARRSLQRITGLDFRDKGQPPEHPPGAAEISAWKEWWSRRRTMDAARQ